MLTMLGALRGFGLVAIIVLEACGSQSSATTGGSGADDGGLDLNLPPPEPGTEQYLRLCARYGLGQATRVAVSPDSSRVALGGADVVLSFATADGELLQRYPVEGLVESVDFSPDAQELAVAAGGTVTLFDAATAAVSKTFERPSENVSVSLAVRYSPAGGLVAVADVQRIRLHELPSGAVLRDVDGEFAWSSDRVAFSPDGTALFARTLDGTSAVDPDTGLLTNLHTAATQFHGAVAAGPDGLLAAGDTAGNVLVWQGVDSTPLLEKTLAGDVDSMAISSDGTLLAATSADREGDLHVWEIETGVERLHESLSVFLGELYGGSSVRFAKTGEVLFANDGYRLRGYSLLDGQSVADFGWGHAGWFEDAAMSPDARLIASSARDQIIVWNRADESIVTTLHPPGISGQVVFSPDSQRLYSTVQGTLFEWDPASGALLRQSAELHRSLITELGISADGTRLLAGIGANEYLMISADSLEPLFSVPVPDSFASVAAFSPDSTAFVGAKNPGEVTAWDSTSGAELESVTVEPDITAVLFSADGTRLIVAARYDVHVYSWPWLTLLFTLKRHEARIFRLLPIDDAHVLSFGGDNRRLVLWDMIAGRAISEGAVDEGGVPRIALPSGMNVSFLIPRSGALRTYCNEVTQAPIYFPPVR